MAIIQQNRRGISGRNYVTRKQKENEEVSEYPPLVDYFYNYQFNIEATQLNYDSEAAEIPLNKDQARGCNFIMVPVAGSITSDDNHYYIWFNMYSMLNYFPGTGEYVSFRRFVPSFTTPAYTSPYSYRGISYNPNLLASKIVYIFDYNALKFAATRTGINHKFDQSYYYSTVLNSLSDIYLSDVRVQGQYYYSNYESVAYAFYDDLTYLPNFTGSLTVGHGFLNGQTGIPFTGATQISGTKIEYKSFAMISGNTPEANFRYVWKDNTNYAGATYSNIQATLPGTAYYSPGFYISNTATGIIGYRVQAQIAFAKN